MKNMFFYFEVRWICTANILIKNCFEYISTQKKMKNSIKIVIAMEAYDNRKIKKKNE
jgi:hypothetical protein